MCSNFYFCDFPSPLASVMDFIWFGSCSMPWHYCLINLGEKKDVFPVSRTPYKMYTMWFGHWILILEPQDMSTACVAAVRLSSSTFSPEDIFKRVPLRSRPTLSPPFTSSLSVLPCTICLSWLGHGNNSKCFMSTNSGPGSIQTCSRWNLMITLRASCYSHFLDEQTETLKGEKRRPGWLWVEAAELWLGQEI